ncbi:MAG: 50S ribosomal protein L25 [Chloroflexi bacterium]|nr:50S ribosomal protein L25 [Anaerolinea sp.]TDA64847.1 MAG: 50S ribosomal protein L25 [Chloroflexota bacterium]
MEKVLVEAARRTVTGKQVGALRRAGKLPGVMYGHNFEPVAIEMDFRNASRVLKKASQSQIVTIVLDGKELATLVRERQMDYIRNEFLHVDFQVVSLTEKIRSKVSIELVGVSPAVKDLNGVVVHEMTEIEVEGLPQDLPEKYSVDISGLTNIGQSILVSALKVSDQIEILHDLNDVVVVITGGAVEEVEEVTEAVAEPEVIERGKKEEEVED